MNFSEIRSTDAQTYHLEFFFRSTVSQKFKTLNRILNAAKLHLTKKTMVKSYMNDLRNVLSN